MALLALLATAPSRTLSRTKLVGLVWPDVAETRGRNRLNTYIHQIRGALGEHVLVSRGEDVGLDDARIRCDVWEFERAVEEEDEEAAVALYRGPYLDGFRLDGSPEFEQRIDLDRSRLRRVFHDALEALAGKAEAAGDPAGAARWWRRRVDDDPYDSRVTRQLMLALARAGNRAEALRVAAVHARLLETELGARPGADVEGLARELRSRDPASASAEPAAPNGSPRPAEREPDPPSVADPGAPTRPSGDARPAAGRPAARRGRSTTIFLILGLLTAGAALGWYVAGRERPGSGRQDRAIAVLPFERLPAASPATDEFADALAEGLHSDLSTRLAAIPGLEVRPRSSVLRFREDERAPSEIATELDVRWLLIAEIQRSGDEVRLNARLLDAPAGRQVWTQAFRREWTAGDLFDMEADIAGAIARALEVRLSPEAERRLQTVPTDNTAAYELYLHARQLDRSPRAVGVVRQELELYHRALELDPAFAEAWAWIADAYLEMAWAGEGLEVWSDSALRAAGRALELDPELADAHSQLADVYWTLGRTEDAISAYERALELQPSHYEAINNLLTLLERRGRLADKMKWAEKARRLSPTADLPVAIMASLNAEIGRDETADRWFAYGRERGQDMLWTEFHVALHDRRDLERAGAIVEDLAREEDGYRIDRRRGALALYRGDWEDARRYYRRLYPGVPRVSVPVYRGLLWDPLCLAHVLDRLGDPAQAREIAREVVGATRRELPADPDYPARHRMAVASLILGDTVAALDWLEEAVDLGHRDARLLESVPTLAPLRDHPRFLSLLERMRTLVAAERQRIESEGWGTPGELD